MFEPILTKVERIPQIIRFIMVGGICAVIQLTFLYTLAGLDIQKNLANLVAFAISVQPNFFLSYNITWVDRRSPDITLGQMLRKLLAFNATCFSALVINQIAFALVLPTSHYLLAGMAGIGAAVVINYTMSHKFVFARPKKIERVSVLVD